MPSGGIGAAGGGGGIGAPGGGASGGSGAAGGIGAPGGIGASGGGIGVVGGTGGTGGVGGTCCGSGIGVVGVVSCANAAVIASAAHAPSRARDSGDCFKVFMAGSPAGKGPTVGAPRSSSRQFTRPPVCCVQEARLARSFPRRRGSMGLAL